MRTIAVIIFFHAILGATLIAQISKNGQPKSFTYLNDNLSEVPIIEMPDFDIKKLLKEDSIINLGGLKSFRFAKSFDVNLDVKSYGLTCKSGSDQALI